MALFKGMYDIIKQSTKTTLAEKILIHKDISPILSADLLLATDTRQQSFTEIRSLLNLPEEEFYQTFRTVTENFSEFVQNLSDTTGEILDRALKRAALSLSLCRTYLLSEEVTLSSLAETEMIWIYAVFTAALFYDIGKLATRHHITLTDTEGNTIKTWLPYAGAMTRSEASHYALGFNEDSHDHMRWIVTPLLARQIMPEEGFNWLASDPVVFECWLSLLSDENRQVSSILTVVRIVQGLEEAAFYTDKKMAKNNLSPQILALFAKIKKDYTEKSKYQKDIRDKMLSENFDRERYKKALISDKTLPGQSKEFSKTSSVSIFKMPVSADNKITNPAEKNKTIVIEKSSAETTKRDPKKIAGKLIEFLKKTAQSKAVNTGMHVMDKNVYLTDQLLQQFINENKLPVSVDQLKKMLTDMHIINPIELLKQTGQVMNAVLVLNPFVIFPSGPPPMIPGGELFQVVSSREFPEVNSRPHIPTAQENYDLEQKRAENLSVTQPQFHTPRPTYYPGST